MSSAQGRIGAIFDSSDDDNSPTTPPPARKKRRASDTTECESVAETLALENERLRKRVRVLQSQCDRLSGQTVLMDAQIEKLLNKLLEK